VLGISQLTCKIPDSLEILRSDQQTENDVHIWWLRLQKQTQKLVLRW
jgi:hypothetical protein